MKKKHDVSIEYGIYAGKEYKTGHGVFVEYHTDYVLVKRGFHNRSNAQKRALEMAKRTGVRHYVSMLVK